MTNGSPDKPNPATLVPPNLKFAIGKPEPFGAALRRGGINFAIFSEHATAVTLVLFAPLGSNGASADQPIAEFALDPRLNRTGNVWHAFIGGLDGGVRYGFRLDARPNPDPKRLPFDPSLVLLDPYAKAVGGRPVWGLTEGAATPRTNFGLIPSDAFDWGLDAPLRIAPADSVIYEMHVRGFTRHASSGVTRPGTFAGLIEKIPYLKDLGVTAVELLPVNEFDETENYGTNPFTGERLLNFWGYQPVGFFAPKMSYAAAASQGAEAVVIEFKEMVKAFHAAGLEVILDVVFNHTAEGDERGRTLSFKGIDNDVYYLLDPAGNYLNFSGCGNTVNCNHPVVRDFILECLRYWVTEMHVDGFRFDLASILGRGEDGEVLSNPPLLERIAADPVLADTKLIAEAWDAAGLYQVGTFPNWGRWAEWNGKFRDDIRRFVKSDPGLVSTLATRLVGSPDLYQSSQRQPYASINFVTCHDGFTLADLVAYNEKHNQMNDEGNTDGSDLNWSWNCGWEGPTDNPDVNCLRVRQAKNLMALLLVADGVPMLLAGDEMRRTQQGNNNPYCQDNEVSWINWDLQGTNADMVRFIKLLIDFRLGHASLRRRSFDEGADPTRISWHGVKLNQPDWSYDSRSLAMQLARPAQPAANVAGSDGASSWPEENIFLIVNADWEPLTFELPPLSTQSWYRFVDTTLAAPDEISDPGREAALTSHQDYEVGPRSVVILIGK